ncbi:TPA: hypothetical protein ACTYUV_005019 [Citrobacter freundii]|uniref:Prokaryotic membrane lipoprotein n=2 Tax=Klebsiella pneumoniae TaxID=573 RepID=A0A223DQG7_KLEPN|nr:MULTISPECIES: hypothetical protein [Citrobacter freundii complex]ASS84956.1 Prokaryotic membrane lipoprotein [Klebsiella pneumoniae]MBJ9068040.1 hypothetical protein [Citrobacter freundii]NSL36178.1 hypothetical protein [Citrobacter werkmanii]
MVNNKKIAKSKTPKIIIFMMLTGLFGCDQKNEVLKAKSENVQNTQVRIYGFVCNKDGELWERHREKIDVTQAVFIDGKLVHCTPDKNDSAIFDSGSYLMGREGYFVIDGVEYPRSEIFERWDKSQLNL